MKINLPIVFVLCLLCAACSKSKSSGGISPSALIPDPSTTDFSAINAYFDRGFAAAISYQNRDTSLKAAHGKPVLLIKELVQKRGKALAYPESIEPSRQAPSTFPVPSAVHGDVPLFSAYDGGYIHIFNGFNKSYSDNVGEGKLPRHIELVYVCRKYPTTIQEQFHAGYGFPVYKFGDKGSAVMGISKFVEFTTKTADKAGNFEDLECVIINEVYYNDGTGKGEIFLTDSRGDLISQGTFNELNATGGPQYIQNATVGAGGHPINHDFFGMWYTLGRVLTPEKRAEVIAKLKQIYPVGKMPDKPYCLPVLKWNSSKKSFDATLNYKPGSSGAPIDSARTIVRWYYGNKRGGEVKETGNHLDEQDLIATTDGRTLSLVRASYSSKFPNTPLINDRNIVNVGVVVYDTQGNYWSEVSAVPLADSK